MAKDILVGFGIDVDAVAGWLGSYGGEDLPDDISRGLFAGEVGSPRLLKMFERFGIKTTWFIPGHSIETFPKEMQAVADAGHEIGIHGYSHENPIAMTREQEIVILDKCIDLVTKLSGKRPTGYVAPWWEFSTVTNELLLERGIKYDHSLMHNDFHPYYVRVGDSWTKIDYSKQPSAWMTPLKRGVETDLIEIPANWYLDDLPPMMFIKKKPEQPRFRQSAAPRGDVAGSIRLGLSGERLCRVPDHDSPRRFGAASGADDARAALQAHRLARRRAICHDERDGRRFRQAVAAQEVAVAEAAGEATMCSLCGILGANEHWADAAAREGVYTRNADPMRRRRERAHRVRLANQVLASLRDAALGLARRVLFCCRPSPARARSSRISVISGRWPKSCAVDAAIRSPRELLEQLDAGHG